MRILLIEDDVLDANDIVELIAADMEATGVVKRVASMAAARQALRAEPFDVVLVDLSLPDASGTDTVQALLEEDDSKPLIVLSGTDNVAIAVETVRLGAQDYLVKGQFTAEAMNRAIRYAIERKQIERRLHYLVGFDQLTGLANRQQLYDVMRKVVARSDRHSATGALLFIDLDRFKFVNDRVGHAAGDELLVAVANRITNVVREEDTVARLGGDEFAVVLPAADSSVAAQTVAEKIVNALELPFELHGQVFSVSASVGITLYPDDGSEVAGLLRNADLAMYQAKRAGPGNFRFYTPCMNERAEQRHLAEQNLREALASDRLQLLYQPVVNLKTGSLLGLEAAVYVRGGRETSRRLEEVASGVDQLPGVQEAGLWALRQVCRDINAWQAAGAGVVPVTLNAFASHWHHDAFPKQVERCIVEANVDAALVRIELPEAILQNGNALFAERVFALARAGIAVGIDTFGTAHCSLLKLKDLPVDALKIDPDIIRAIDGDRTLSSVVDAILAVAHSLGKTVVAEGVETQAQVEKLRRAGCRWGQGVFFGEQLSQSVVESLLMGQLLVETPQWRAGPVDSLDDLPLTMEQPAKLSAAG